ncbi:MAG: hypothetical protein ACOZBW_14695 [Thermodesulfobacteriota bacterium]
MIFHTPSCYVLFFGGKKSTKRTLSIYHFPLNDFAKSRAVVAAASRGASACAARQAAMCEDNRVRRSLPWKPEQAVRYPSLPIGIAIGIEIQEAVNRIDPEPDPDSDVDRRICLNKQKVFY